MSLLGPASSTAGRRPLLGAAARALLDDVASAHHRIRAIVCAPTRCGKSTLLDELAEQYRARGVRVLRQEAAFAPRTASAHTAVIIDDAHELDASGVERLRRLSDEDGVDIVVGVRTGDGSPELMRVLREFERLRAPTLLGPVSAGDIATHLSVPLASSVSMTGPAGTDAAGMLALTGGMPWLVCAIAKTASQGSLVDPLDSIPLRELVVHEYESLDEPLRRHLVARAVGFDAALMAADASPANGVTESAERLDERARAEGMLLAAGATLPLLDHMLLETTPAHRVASLTGELVRAAHAAGRPLDGIAEHLLARGVRDPLLASWLVRLADRALTEDPALAARRYAQAVKTGADARSVSARRAQAAFGAGDAQAATRFADDALAGAGSPEGAPVDGARLTPREIGRAAAVAAAGWAQRSMLTRSADVYRHHPSPPSDPHAPIVAVTMIGTGDRAGADLAWPAAGRDAAPTLLNAAAALFGEGVRASLGDSSDRALATLARASDSLTESGAVMPWPDTPAAVAAIVALGSGEPDVAASVLDSALRSAQGGAPARRRLMLLQAWVVMQSGQLDRARRIVTEACPDGASIDLRDDFLRCAIDVGIARRAENTADLVAAWRRARVTLLHVTVDLYSLLPLGELAVAAARLRDTDRVTAHLADAWALLERLGEPPLWSTLLHWSAIQAAILADRPADVAPHAAALVRAADGDRTAAVLASGGRAWMSVLGGQVDALAVESAARAFEPVGLAWEGSRLAGHASARAAERRDMVRLLACARDLHPTSDPAVLPDDVAGDLDRAPDATSHGLTAREQQIARLVLDGRTYWEIGEAVFISPRTVEHHVARMRRRLGVASRSELLVRLREQLGG